MKNKMNRIRGKLLLSGSLKVLVVIFASLGMCFGGWYLIEAFFRLYESDMTLTDSIVREVMHTIIWFIQIFTIFVSMALCMMFRANQVKLWIAAMTTPELEAFVKGTQDIIDTRKIKGEINLKTIYKEGKDKVEKKIKSVVMSQGNYKNKC